MNKQILIVEDDLALGSVMQAALNKRGFTATWLQTIGAAKASLKDITFDLAILDLKLAGETTLQLLPLLLAQNGEIKILILTGYASIATAVEATKRGATNYLPKPATIAEILAALDETHAPLGGTEPHAQTMMSPKRLEWEHIQRVLLRNDGNISLTARDLNMHRRTLQRKLQKKPVKD
ncbi:MAG: two-component system response regulator RegA [Lentisphaeria bacterium]|jgi:two-component system response regulator RegA